MRMKDDIAPLTGKVLQPRVMEGSSASCVVQNGHPTCHRRDVRKLGLLPDDLVDAKKIV